MASTKIKVMDVSKPGSTAPDASSKPVIVGHKPMVADPMVSRKGNAESEPKPLAQTGKKLEPISADMKVTEKKEGQPKKAEAPKTEPEVTPSEKPEITEPKPEVPETKPEEAKSPEPEETEEKKPKDDKAKEEEEKKLAAEAEAAAKVQELIDSKKYFVKIDDSNTRSIKTFVMTVLIVVLVGTMALTALIDAEVLDLGIGLPFDLIK